MNNKTGLASVYIHHEIGRHYAPPDPGEHHLNVVGRAEITDCEYAELVKLIHVFLAKCQRAGLWSRQVCTWQADESRSGVDPRSTRNERTSSTQRYWQGGYNRRHEFGRVHPGNARWIGIIGIPASSSICFNRQRGVSMLVKRSERGRKTRKLAFKNDSAEKKDSQGNGPPLKYQNGGPFGMCCT